MHNAPFYLFVAGAFTFLTVPRMSQAGMFLDGMIYASIARNLAAGIGTFWFPSYSAIDPGFHEHPPLGFALEAVPFWLFGDHLAVERAFSLAVSALTGLLIVAIWRHTVGQRAYDWLPLVFWLLPSTVTWAIINNLLETTQAMFTTAAILGIVLSLRRGIAWAIVAGLCVVAAFLVKGPGGFFPLAAPFIAAAVMRASRAAAIRSGLAMIGTVAAAAAALLSSGPARVALRAYWDAQVLSSIAGARGGGRWASLARHLGGGIFLRMGGLLLLAWLARSRRSPSPRSEAERQWVMFFWGVALSASLPLAISARVSGHYLVPAIPFFALAFAGTALPAIRPRFDAWRPHAGVRRTFGAVGVVLLAAAVVIPISGGAMEPRDAAWVSEYRSLAGALPRRQTIGTCEAVRMEWGVHAYMQRFFSLSLDAGPETPRRYFLRVTDRPCEGPPACHEVAASARLALLECLHQVAGGR
jgi:4-amino-4-deoxy-L-arabinose transferase-like glycosyltransferase